MVNHPMVQARRVYDEPLDDDTRVLVDRLWPRGMSKPERDWMNGAERWPPQQSCGPGITTSRNVSTNSPAAILTNSSTSSELPALVHLRDIADHGSLTLLTATKTPDLSEAAVLVTVLATDSG